MCVPTCACLEDRDWHQSVFFNSSLTCGLRQGLSTEAGVHRLARLADHQVLGISLSSYPLAGIVGVCCHTQLFILCWGFELSSPWLHSKLFTNQAVSGLQNKQPFKVKCLVGIAPDGLTGEDVLVVCRIDGPFSQAMGDYLSGETCNCFESKSGLTTQCFILYCF